jgi:hypothetical protein
MFCEIFGAIYRNPGMAQQPSNALVADACAAALRAFFSAAQRKR